MTLPAPPTRPCANVAGPVDVYVDTGTSNAMVWLGRTINGVMIEETSFMGEIHDDSYGGEQGPPTDYQRFGGQHRISLEMQLYVDAVLALVEIGYTAAATPAVGMMVGCQGAAFRVLLLGTNFTRNYEYGSGAGKGNCFLLDPVERSPIGSQASRARLTFTANYLPGALPYDSVITSP